MSTKTIAVESSVYEKNARHKRASESFAKTISRLLETSTIIHTRQQATAAEVLEALPDPPSYSAFRALLRILEGKRQDPK